MTESYRLHAFHLAFWWMIQMGMGWEMVRIFFLCFAQFHGICIGWCNGYPAVISVVSFFSHDPTQWLRDLVQLIWAAPGHPSIEVGITLEPGHF
ncbi:hypothetical protein QBC37DRAFT_161737 [Rhypophila decipiens]|uniref:Uncharacterized protein n=1 Tax=Rhypophila decipiens TaxID=261697 RepID=A0AAN6Y7E7_9PEZI|nr:hypothetical protein QBC37DRAFT_161737 [Rhypophila decipiens]